MRNLTGQKFNRWLVIEYAGRNKHRCPMWKCKCDCGNERIIVGQNLVNERTKSCGCLQKEITSKRTFNSLVDKRFNKLLVIERIESNKYGQAMYKCKCDCGKIITAIGVELTRKHTKSCGCMRQEKTAILTKKGYGEASFNRLYGNYKRSANKNKHEFTLSKEEFKEIVQQPCTYCGRQPYARIINKSKNGDFDYNGIDRVDNSKGYIKGNVEACCMQCNYAKKNYTKEEFCEWIVIVYKNLHEYN